MLKALRTFGCLFAVAAVQLAPFSQAAAANDETPATATASCGVRHADAAVSFAAQPDYPTIAQELRLSGTTYVKVDLSATGDLLDASVYESSGSAILDYAALRAARMSSFRSEITDCSPVPGSYIYAVDFAP